MTGFGHQKKRHEITHVYRCVNSVVVMLCFWTIVDTGHGTLYTSGAQGVVYSESLPKHLYPNYGEVTDFYRVESMRGVYITSQILEDNSIRSMITYNRGATWQTLGRPKGAMCKDEQKVSQNGK